MNTAFLDKLVCPVTKETFKLIELEKISETDGLKNQYERIYTGILIAKHTNIAYPIIRGIPRIIRGAFVYYERNLRSYKKIIQNLGINNLTYSVDKEFNKFYLPTLKRFEKEWKEHEIKGRTWGLSQPERLNKYLEYMGIKLKGYNDNLFLDVGCGTGQLTCTIAESLNCQIVGVDLTPSIEKGEMIRKTIKNKSNVTFIQANLMELPFKSEIFNFIHASGVLHHTPNTRKAFNSVERFTKPGGKLGVWIYRKRDTEIPLLPFVKSKKFVIYESNARKITTKINHKVLYLLILFYSAFFHICYKLNTLLRNRRHNQTIKERTTSLFDALAPTFAHKHSPGEIKKWFYEKNYLSLIETDQDDDAGFNICGIKA